MAIFCKFAVVFGIVLFLITMYHDVNADSQIEGCKNENNILSCVKYFKTELPSVNEVSAFTEFHFVDCWYEINITAIQYTNALSLVVDNCALTSLPARSFDVLIKLEQLALTGNRIRSVDGQAFLALSRLINLDLSNNKLESLPTGLLDQLISLKNLDLSGNSLAEGTLDLVYTKPSNTLINFVCNRYVNLSLCVHSRACILCTTSIR